MLDIVIEETALVMLPLLVQRSAAISMIALTDCPYGKCSLCHIVVPLQTSARLLLTYCASCCL